MGVTRKQALHILGGSGAAAAAAPWLASPATAGEASVAGAADGAAGGATSGRVIRRDVCVIGGGSSGTYTAVRLRDLGLSVAVVERTGRLGGHCETFHDPVTGGTLDIGVIVFHDLPLVRDYFARFDIPLAAWPGTGNPTTYLDFRTGVVVPGYSPPPPVALPAYLDLLQRYPYLDTGFELPDPVPAELLLPFGEIVTRYGLESIVALVFRFGQGLGDILRQPAIYVMKNFGISVVNSVFAGSFVMTARANNSELYEKATADLGDDVLLRTEVKRVSRDRHGVRVELATAHGPRTIVCRKLVVTVPPVLRNLAGFDLDHTETKLFGRFRNSFYWTAVARLSGIPQDRSVQNAAPETPYNLPPLPGIYGLGATAVPGLHNVKYGSGTPVSDRRVYANIVADINRLRTAGTFPVELQGLEVFKSHSPFELTVPAADIDDGFYRRLYALQGRNHTFYNGAAFHTHDSTLLWRFTETLLPRIAES